MPSEPSAIRPLVSARDVAHMADARNDPQFYAPDVAQDLTFLPGYSDKRRARDEDLRKYGRSKIKLTHRYQFVPVVSADGQRPDLQKAARWMALGYRRVKMDEMASLGVQPPLGAYKTADGHCRIGDSELFVCDAKTAARNDSLRRSAIDANTADDSVAQELHRVGSEVARAGETLTFAETTQEPAPNV